MITDIMLKRTNQRPLRFVGEYIASVATPFELGVSHRAAVYRRGQSAEFVLSYARYSQWQGDIGTYEAWRRRSLEEIATLIEEKGALEYAEWPTRLVDELLEKIQVTEINGIVERAEEAEDKP